MTRSINWDKFEKRLKKWSLEHSKKLDSLKGIISNLEKNIEVIIYLFIYLLQVIFCHLMMRSEFKITTKRIKWWNKIIGK